MSLVGTLRLQWIGDRVSKMKCTAPVRGHRSARARSRCPACRGGGGWSAPASSGFLPPVQAGHGTGGKATRPRERRSPDARRVADVQHSLIQAGLDATTSGHLVSALIDVAASLDEEASKHSKPDHCLCTLLADVADALDPGVITAVAGDVFADALVESGMPRWAATVAGWGVAKSAEGALSSMLPGGQLVLGLRVLGMLVCPRPSSCPAQSRLSVPVLKAIIGGSPVSADPGM